MEPRANGDGRGSNGHLSTSEPWPQSGGGVEALLEAAAAAAASEDQESEHGASDSDSDGGVDPTADQRRWLRVTPGLSPFSLRITKMTFTLTCLY